MATKTNYDQEFLLQNIKHAALRTLEEKVEHHIKSEFYNKWLPKVIDQLRKDLMVEIVTDHDCFDLKIKLKKPEEI